jgi:hypothetical protein
MPPLLDDFDPGDPPGWMAGDDGCNGTDDLFDVALYQSANSGVGCPSAMELDPGDPPAWWCEDEVYLPAVSVVDEAEALLEDPDLLERFLRDIWRDGLVGEHIPALTILLIGISRIMDDPLNGSIKSGSSAGKTSLVRRVLRHFPLDDLVMIDDLSPKALAYLPDSLDRKIVVIAEYVGAEKAEYFLRIAMSERKLITYTVGRSPKPEHQDDDKGTDRKGMATQRREVNLRSAFITTTTRGLANNENETRVIEITLDESPEQTRRIVVAQAKAAEHIVSPEEKEASELRCAIWRTALSMLEPFHVVVPGATALATAISVGRVRARRDFQKVLSLARAHALLHQRQREIEDAHLIATSADLDVAHELAGALAGEVPPRLATVLEKLTDQFGQTEFPPGMQPSYSAATSMRLVVICAN